VLVIDREIGENVRELFRTDRLMNAHRIPLTSLVIAGALIAPCFLEAEELTITSFGRNGELTFVCPVPDQTYRVEWAASPEGPWSSSWDDLFLIEPGSASSVTVTVPMFYRVKTPARVQAFTSVSGAEAGPLIRDNEGNPDFIILDIRRADEYETGHIVGALEIDYYGPTFDEVLALLPRDKVYLLHCRSGGRSANARATMEMLGFVTVYEIAGGFIAFNTVPENADLIE
jgi:rhodanese-related sulfurtransferase